ncbi:U6 small nuclear RNA (adenine-(43)-N(6))-methyltransferase [Adelges cooleyi]|uniref:U6 small nuclear RNA (adenine-(43)-N(6))-methyltransferase n=1 Tax=Adelges cooleyi TaxID=133065 RepID=UPI002180840F|nr:U6 small nuclear RNA (adenine-(43)-N(6))-methyltransferase [Adelges cooleyi]XP_050440227.1 U6 small nuclear RNA (adenine-(43)-N(6))-methyltransferase [Adelges cooleyi]
MPKIQLMHPRNLYRTPPNFKELADNYPEFRKYATTSLDGKIVFDFKNQDGLRVLTRILLKKDFDLDVDLPVGKLIPTVPLRLNYILWIEDLLNLNNSNSSNTKGIDIGTGASCIYPLLAAKKFGWSMVGTDINKESVESASKNILKNNLLDRINVLEVSEWDSLLPVKKNEHYDFCMCNPPFHCQQVLNTSDEDDCDKANSCEMYTAGGEVDFVKKIISESERLLNSISIYTTMIGYKSSLKPLKKELQNIGAKSICEAGFFQGRTARWGIAWTFQPDIKLIDFMPTKDFKKKALKPPVSFALPDSYDANTALSKLNELLISLKLAIVPCKTPTNKDTLFQADVKAYENTWVHQRRKRRMEQRTIDNKRQKLQESTPEDSYNVVCAQPSETNVNNKTFLFDATFLLRKSNDKIWVDMLHVNGNRDNSHQVFQYLKNRFT